MADEGKWDGDMNVGLYLGSTSTYHKIRIETNEAVNLLLLWHSSNHSNNENAHCFSSTWAKSRNIPKWECRNDTWQPINQVEYLYMTKGITLCVILQLNVPKLVEPGICTWKNTSKSMALTTQIKETKKPISTAGGHPWWRSVDGDASCSVPGPASNTGCRFRSD